MRLQINYNTYNSYNSACYAVRTQQNVTKKRVGGQRTTQGQLCWDSKKTETKPKTLWLKFLKWKEVIDIPPFNDIKLLPGRISSHTCWLHEYLLSRFSRVCLFATPWTAVHQGSSVHGILQARILEWVVMSSSRGSSWLRDQTRISYVSCIAGGFFTAESSGKPQLLTSY